MSPVAVHSFAPKLTSPGECQHVVAPERDVEVRRRLDCDDNGLSRRIGTPTCGTDRDRRSRRETDARQRASHGSLDLGRRRRRQRCGPSAFARSSMQGLLPVIRDAELDDPENEEDEQREYERELDSDSPSFTSAFPNTHRDSPPLLGIGPPPARPSAGGSPRAFLRELRARLALRVMEGRR